jgi:tRNA modification GTPase
MPVWRVRNKIDLESGAGVSRASGEAGSEREFRISASRGDGVLELMTALVAFAEVYFGAVGSGLIARTRQRELLQGAACSLRKSLQTITAGEELAAEDLRAAAYALGRLLGRVDVEDVLGEIFSSFCIGK